MLRRSSQACRPDMCLILFLSSIIIFVAESIDDADEACLLQSQSTLRLQQSSAHGHLRTGTSHSRQNKNTYLRQRLQNIYDVQYVIDFNVGGQDLKAILDTGSYEVLVFSEKCDGCGLGGVFVAYNDEVYTRDKWTSEHSFASGTAKSRLARDDMSVGSNLTNLTVSNQYFWEVFKATMPVVRGGTFNAIIGIGPQSTALAEAEEAANISSKKAGKFIESDVSVPKSIADQARNAKKFVKVMSKEPTLLQNLQCSVFSMCLGKRSGSDGWFVWNDYVPSIFDTAFLAVKVSAKRNWGVKVSSVRLGSELIGCSKGCGAIFDSGTSLIAAPPKIYTKLKKLFAALDNDCSKIKMFPNLKFVIDGQSLELPPHAYIGKSEGNVSKRAQFLFPGHDSNSSSNSKCQLLLMQMPTESQLGPMWILGMPFFRQYYTTFQRKGPENERKLYFAHAGQNCTVDYSFPFQDNNPSVPSWFPKIDFAKITIPGWLENMALKKHHVI